MARRKRIKQPLIPIRIIFLFIVFIGIFTLAVGVKTLFFSNSTNSQQFGCKALDLSGGYNVHEKNAYFNSQLVAQVPGEIIQQNLSLNVLGESNDAKWVEVDLSEQKVRAWDGGNLFMETLVSTGKWGRTPVGEFRVWTKLRYTKMSGGSQELGTYYYLPNVPYTMFFAGSGIPASRGYALHGTYWHNNFGTPMSHGCINLPTPAAEQIFNWSGPNLRIVIHE